MQEDKDIEEYVKSTDIEEAKKGSWKGKLSGFLSGAYFIPTVIILVAIIAFALGRVSGLQEKREPVRVTNSSPNPSLNLREGSSTPPGAGEVKGASAEQVVASKSGTKYHYPWCAGAKQISEKNKITFNSIDEARAAGYTPASNCKGLK